MKALMQSDYQAWCEQRGLQIRGRGILRSERSISIVLRIPDETRSVLSLICDLFPKDEPFSGGLFWIVDTGSLSDDIIDLGLTIQRLMRKAYGYATPNAPSSDVPPCLFEEDERLQAQGFLAQPLLFSWGGYFVPNHAQYFFDINPDGVLEVVTETDRWIDFFSAFPEKMGMRQHGSWIP
jgi:hypothetical protein